MPPRFLTLDQVADELATSRAQVYALVRSGELPAIKIGATQDRQLPSLIRWLP